MPKNIQTLDINHVALNETTEKTNIYSQKRRKIHMELNSDRKRAVYDLFQGYLVRLPVVWAFRPLFRFSAAIFEYFILQFIIF